MKNLVNIIGWLMIIIPYSYLIFHTIKSMIKNWKSFIFWKEAHYTDLALLTIFIGYGFLACWLILR